MSAITTHILDISMGAPVWNVPVRLEKETDEGWQLAGQGVTDDDGRLKFTPGEDEIFGAGNYRLTFDTDPYFAGRDIEAFYPQVAVAFTVRDAAQHYHVPLLLSPFGYSTYRGS
jgi:5-hydroxyisourate hydrolase